MKKLLALVLALVMTLSLAVVGSNAAFKDAEKVNASYAEAVDVLAGMKVFQGYPDGSFQPEGSITRAEVAAIVYRLYTADVADKQASLYATYNKFADMDGAAWAKGYIGYCGNAGLIKGYDAKTFGPADKVTGYQALAMILRAVGYDKNDEFTGAQWQLRVASTAQQLGILKNVKGVDLNAAASRELVAELLFRTAAYVPMVTYTPALGYTNLTAILNGKTNLTLGEKNFGLTKTAASNDKWGRPLYKWTDGKTTVYATIKATPVATYTKAVAECDVAHDAGLKVDTAYALWVNGDKLASKYTVNLTDTVTKMGAQGRLVEVYDDTIVMIDTFLAKVANVYDATYDAQGHLKTPATIILTVEDGSKTPLTLTNGTTNYAYAKDDMVLVNAFTNSNSAISSGALVVGAKQYGEIVAKATSIDGAQSILYWNAKQHNVDGTVYDDAYKFILNQAGTSTAKYTWFFDQYNNLIGSVEIAAATSYGVINSIWWAGNAADGTGVAKATVTYMDGTTGTIDLGKITVVNGATVNCGVPTYSVIAGDIMTVTGTTAVPGNFFVTTNAATNAAKDYTNATPNVSDIVAGHMFQFKTLANGTVAAVEVATATGFKNPTMKVYKDTQINSNGLVANTNTVYLVRSGSYATGYTYKSVTGFNAIADYESAEVDFVLNNGVAQYVYITAPATTAKSTSVFFYAGGQATYDYTTKLWTIPGYVDGTEGKITIAGLNDAKADAILDLTTGRGTANTLWCVALENGEAKGVWSYASDAVLSPATVAGVSYPLATAYQGLSQVRVRVIEGNMRDYMDGQLFRHDSTPNAVTATYAESDIFAVVDNAAIKSQINGDWTALGTKLIYVAYVSGAGQYQRAIIHANIIDNNQAVLPSAHYISNVSVSALTAPVLHSNVANYATTSAFTWNSSDGAASADSVKVTVEWSKWNGTEYVPYTNPSFDAGDYQATITVKVDNTNNANSYVIDGRTAITYSGVAQTAATFVSSNINVH